MTGRRVDLADQLHQAGISNVGIQETRCRGQVTGSCQGFGAFAAAADKAGRGGVELWIRQEIMGESKSFHVLVAESRFLLVKGHTAAGVIQFCVCVMGVTARATKLKFRRRGVVPRHSSGAHVWFLYRSSCHVMPMRGLDLSRRWPLAIRRRIGRIRLARNFMLCSWNGTFVCQPRCPERGVPGHGGIGLISWLCLAIWLAGVKRAEVETAVALPGSGSFDHAMPIVEVVFRLRRQVTSVQEVLTLLARLCGDLRFASRSSFSGLRLLLFLRSFRWTSTPSYWQRLSGWLGDVRPLGCKLRHRRTGWTRRLGRRSALMLWREAHTKRPAGFTPERGSRRFSRSGGRR